MAEEKFESQRDERYAKAAAAHAAHAGLPDPKITPAKLRAWRKGHALRTEQSLEQLRRGREERRRVAAERASKARAEDSKRRAAARAKLADSRMARISAYGESAGVAAIAEESAVPTGEFCGLYCDWREQGADHEQALWAAGQRLRVREASKRIVGLEKRAETATD